MVNQSLRTANSTVSSCCGDVAESQMVQRHYSQHLQSRVGRHLQRFDGSTRLLACVVVTRRVRCSVHHIMHKRRLETQTSDVNENDDAISTSSSSDCSHMGEDQILVITSSKHPNEWIIPKGGWEMDETVHECAMREADEEAGVAGEIIADLGMLDFQSKQGKRCRFYGFRMNVQQIFHEWAESTRQRQWVSVEEAKRRLQHRPEMLDMLARAIDRSA